MTDVTRGHHFDITDKCTACGDPRPSGTALPDRQCPGDDGIGELVFCHCGKSIDDVSLPHYLSCWPGSGFTEEEATDMVGRIVTRVEDGLS